MRATINIYRNIDKSSIYNGTCTTRVFDLFVDSVEEVKLIAKSIITTSIDLRRTDENIKFKAAIEGEKFSMNDTTELCKFLSLNLTDKQKYYINCIDIIGESDRKKVDLTIYQMPIANTSTSTSN